MSIASTVTGWLGGGRDLRRRAAIAVGVLTTLVVLVFGVTAWLLVGRSLQAATDADLRASAEALLAVGLERAADDSPFVTDRGEASEGGGPVLPSGSERPPVPYVQFLGTDGDALFGELPPSERAVAVARGEAEGFAESVDLDGRVVRVVTVALVDEPGGALRIGTDITNTVEGLRRARVATTGAGLVAGLVTAAVAWLLAGHLIAPVTAVADAADRLRRDDELPDRLTGEGPDELGRLTASFNALLDDLRRSRAQQRRLVADASHELRTPLTSLRVKIEFIQSQPGLATRERQRLLDGAVADLGVLADLVSELVELAADGATPERPRLVDLAELVTAEVDRFRATSGRPVEVSTDPGMVETRPRQIVRALSNLLVNADKYSPAGTPIGVRQNGPRIEVRDRGPGIPAGERALVFDRFYRGRAHQSVDGSGLGLAIVESVARANGGTTWVADAPDGGPGVVVGFSAGPTPGP